MKLLLTALLFIVYALPVNALPDTIQPFEVRVTGKGTQAILFIPGFACSGEVWSDTRMHFEQNFKCYTLTMAGFAGVEPTTNATFQSWENGIVNFIKENKIEKSILIGHSMGGGLALAIAADHPDLISKIIVVDALPCLAFLFNPNFKSVDELDCSESLRQFTSIPPEQFYLQQKNAITRLVADTSKRELIIKWGLDSDRKTLAEMYCDFSNTDLREKIKSISCPSLILLEPYFIGIKPQIEEQYKNLKYANFQYASKGLHFIMYDDKDWYMNQLENFIPLK